MKNVIARLMVISFTLLAVVSAALGQATETKSSGLNKGQNVSPEEKLIRDTYEKATALSHAAGLLKDEQSSSEEEVDDLKFELSNFHTGPIREILKSRADDIATRPQGDPIIALTRSTLILNQGPEYVFYKAQWQRSQYASIYDPKWTIADVMGFEPEAYFDVGQYTTYEATVSFEGKMRSYRALVLFHNQL